MTRTRAFRTAKVPRNSRTLQRKGALDLGTGRELATSARPLWESSWDWSWISGVQ